MQKLRVPQVRVLRAIEKGGILTRAKINDRAGISQRSGTVWRALNGLKEGSSSGAAHLGLLQLKYLEEVELDIDGVKEVGYRITQEGKKALAKVDELPKMKDCASSTNLRYKKEHQHVQAVEGREEG